MTAVATHPESLADRYRESTPEQRVAAISKLPENQQRELVNGGKPWWFYGRTDQFAPPGSWRWWIINAGRGWGKTRTGAEWSVDKGRRYPGCRFCLVAPTFGDGRDTMVEGDSGMLNSLALSELRGGTIDTGWNRSIGELFLANGTRYKIFSSEQPFRLRGPQHHFGWGDEPSYWRDVAKGTTKDSTWSNMNIGLRLPARKNWGPLRAQFRPQAIMTMTPRLVPLLKVDDETAKREPAKRGLLQRDDITLTTGSTMANLRNLDQSYYDSVIAPVLGTTLGMQELGGILLEEVEGALWNHALLALTRADTGEVGPDGVPIVGQYHMPDATELAKTVVAFDPSGGVGRDEHGVIIASSSGTRGDLQMWVRDDWSVNGSPEEAARRLILAAFEFNADAIVFEKNQGQMWIPGMIEATFLTMRNEGILNARLRLPQLIPVDAKTSKLQRAVPVHAHYERRAVHHVGRFPILEGQMTTWVAGESESPDRLDALVWAIDWLWGEGPARAEVGSPAARERRGRRSNQPSSRLPSVYGTRSARGRSL